LNIDFVRIPEQDANDLALCPVCAAVVFDRPGHRQNHEAWHEAIADLGKAAGAPT
jgi:hypothetical protein